MEFWVTLKSSCGTFQTINSLFLYFSQYLSSLVYPLSPCLKYLTQTFNHCLIIPTWMTILLFWGHATTPEPTGLCSFIHSGSHSALLLMQFCHFGRIRLAFDVHFMLGLDLFIIFSAMLCHNGLRSAPVKAKTNYVHWQERFHVCEPLSSQSVSGAVNMNKPARGGFNIVSLMCTFYTNPVHLGILLSIFYFFFDIWSTFSFGIFYYCQSSFLMRIDFSSLHCWEIMRLSFSIL